MQKKFLTTEEIALFYGIDEDVIHELAEAGDLKALADRGIFRYRREEIESLIKSGRLHATKELPEMDADDLGSDLDFSAEAPVAEQVDYIELDEEALAASDPDFDASQWLDPKAGPSAPTVAENASEDEFDPTKWLQSDSKIAAMEQAELAAADEAGSVIVDQPVAEQPIAQEDSFIGLGSGSGVKATSSSDVVVVLEPAPGLGSDSDIHLEEPAAIGQPPVVAAMDEASQYTQEIEVSEANDHILAQEDSGVTMEIPADDSGLSLDVGDSGLTIDTGDSGISLDTGDSGLSLEKKGVHAAVTEQMEQFDAPVSDEFRFNDELDEEAPRLAMDQTAEDLPGLFDSSDQTTALAATPGSSMEIEEVEVADRLDDMLSDDDVEAEAEAGEDLEEAAEEGVFTDEGEFAEAGADSGVYPAAPGKAKSLEPSWGTPACLMVIVASVLIGLNAWLVVEGMFTMWTGASPSGPAASLISSLAGIGA